MATYLLEHFFKYLFMKYIQGTFVVEARILVLVWLSPYFDVASDNYRFALSKFFDYAPHPSVCDSCVYI